MTTAASAWGEAADVVRQMLAAERMDGIGRDIRVEDRPFSELEVRPGCYITPIEEVYGEGTNESDHIGYGLLVTVVRGSPSGNQTDRRMKWRRDIRRLLHNKRLDSGLFHDDALIHTNCTVEHATQQFAPAQKGHFDATSMLVRVWFWENRV